MPYKPESYETLLEIKTLKRKRAPLTPLQKAQNQAREMAHASNLRTINKAVEHLENWARQARYG
jgi:hypothetical protein